LADHYFAWINILQRQGQCIAFANEDPQLSRTQNVIRITDEIDEILKTEALLLNNPVTARDVGRWVDRIWHHRQVAK
jgi:hypothetical protein